MHVEVFGGCRSRVVLDERGLFRALFLKHDYIGQAFAFELFDKLPCIIQEAILIKDHRSIDGPLISRQLLILTALFTQLGIACI